MRNATSIALVILVLLCGTFLWPSSARADEPIPQLGVIPASITGSERTQLMERRQVLQTRFAAFKAAADAFNAKTAESQADAEFDALRAERAAYIDEANAFNKDLVSAKTTASALVTLPIAHVTARGEFHFVTRDGRTLEASEALMLPKEGGTRAVTGPDGYLEVRLPDGTVFTLGSNSDIVLDNFVYDPADSTIKIRAEILRGTMRWVSGKPELRKDVEIKLPIGSLGLRGTDFEVMVEPSGDGYVKLFEGQLDITRKESGNKFALNAGTMISFNADGTFNPQVPIHP